jgi:preprotein translocase subunit YajC
MTDRLTWTLSPTFPPALAPTLAQDGGLEPPRPTGIDAPPSTGAAPLDATGTTTDASGGATTAPTAAPNPFDPTFLILMIGVIVIMYVVVFGGQRKEKKRKQAMLDAMGKGDRVQTVGGVLGTVIDVKDHEVVLKVDENTNARMRFAKSAIQTVLESSD